MTDIEDKTSNTEKAYLTLEHKFSALPEAGDTEAEKEFRKSVEDKINALETTTGSAVLRLEDAISENAKLARRLEQVTLDKTSILRKMETLEEALTQTQETLRAKALVLLTDHALANKTALAQTPAWNGNDTLRMKEAAATPSVAESLGIEDHPWWKSATPVKMNKAALAALIVLGLLGGWAVAKSDVAISLMPSPAVTNTPPKGQLAEPVKTSQVAPAPKADIDLTQAKSMDDAAKLANAIEPGDDASAAKTEAPAPVVASLATPSSSTMDEASAGTAIDTAKSAEQKALDDFNADKLPGNACPAHQTGHSPASSG